MEEPQIDIWQRVLVDQGDYLRLVDMYCPWTMEITHQRGMFKVVSPQLTVIYGYLKFSSRFQEDLLVKSKMVMILIRIWTRRTTVLPGAVNISFTPHQLRYTCSNMVIPKNFFAQKEYKQK